MKSSELADYSVGMVWQVQGRGQKKNVVDLVRGRFEYPELVAAAVALWRKWKVDGTTAHHPIPQSGKDLRQLA
jgi:hypothetical protein